MEGKMPMYEIWIEDDTGLARHVEDCQDIYEARDALKDWHANGSTAYIRDKETGEGVK